MLKTMTGRLGDIVRRDPLLVGCMCVLSAAVAAPFWLVEFLPLLDIPQHLSTIGVLNGLDDPSKGYQAFFTVELMSTQYLTYYLLCDVLSNLVGVENANKCFISLYAILLPLSLWTYLRAYQRTEAVALLAFPIVFNTFLFYGFINYVFSFPFLFFGLALFKTALDSDNTCYVRQTGLLLISLIIFYSHLQIFLVYFGGIGLAALMHWSNVRTFFIRLVHMAPSTLLLGVWFFRSDNLAGGAGWQRSVAQRYASLTSAEWEPLGHKLGRISDRFLSVYHGNRDEMITVILFVAFMGLLAVRRAPTYQPKHRSLSRYLPELLSLFVVAFYFVMPTSYKWIWPINWRFVPLAVLLLLGWSTWQPERWARRVLTCALAALAAFSISVHVDEFQAFDKEAAEVKPVLDAIEPGARVMSLIFDTGSKVVVGPAFLHFAQYHQLRNGGMAAYSFAEAPQSPVRFRPPEYGGPPPTPLRFEWKANTFRFHQHGRYYDYFMVRGEHPGFSRRAGFRAGEVDRVLAEGRWTLYKNKSRQVSK